jgi:pilus assembly protein CpaF
MSWDIILPFIRNLEALILDPGVSEILVNAPGKVFAERDGILVEVPGIEVRQKQLQIAIRHIARSLGDDVSESRPLLDARLPDGSRVAAVFEPCSVGGVTLAIRKFYPKRFHLAELVRIGAVTEELASVLQAAVRERKNILISGGAGTGKTTLLNALAASIPPDERVVVIEDTAEISIETPNQVHLESRRAQPGVEAVTIRDLLKTTLRLRPDRILLGEIRGAEAFDLLQALNSGHSGSISTIHAESATRALTRFASCTLQSGIGLPYTAIRANIADAINIVVQIERRLGKRYVSEALEVSKYAADSDLYTLSKLFETRSL